MSVPKFGNEDEFQYAVEDLARTHGWSIRHIPRRAYQAAKEAKAPIPAGIPDLELRYYREGQDKPIIVFAELKMPDRVLDSPQEHYLKGFAHIVPCFLWYPQDWEWIEDILKNVPPEPTGKIVEASTSPPISREPLIPNRSIQMIVSRAVNEIRSPDFARGDLAGLRRMNPDSPKTTAFLKVMEHVGYTQDPDDESKWALILHGIALMTPNAHSSSTPVGKALFFGGDPVRQAGQGFYSSTRLNKLLNARGNARRSLMARMFRMTARANQPFDWVEMAEFILNEGHEEKADLTRRRIAREYYRAERRNSQ